MTTSPISWKGSNEDEDVTEPKETTDSIPVMTFATIEIRGRSNHQQVSECSSALSEDASKLVKTAKINYHKHQNS